MRVRPRVCGVSERVPGLWSRDRTLRRKATGQESAHGVSGMPTLPSDGACLAAEAAAFLADQVPDEGREAPRGGSNYRLLLPYTHSQPAERALWKPKTSHRPYVDGRRFGIVMVYRVVLGATLGGRTLRAIVALETSSFWKHRMSHVSPLYGSSQPARTLMELC